MRQGNQGAIARSRRQGAPSSSRDRSGSDAPDLGACASQPRVGTREERTGEPSRDKKRMFMGCG